MKDKIIIRPISECDVENYVKLVNIVWRDAYAHIFPDEVFRNRENGKGEKIKEVKTYAYNDNSQFVYVAEYKGEIVGVMSGNIHSQYEHYKEKGYAELMAIYIHPQFQGLGIGSRLKKLFFDWLKENGVTKFVIGVLKDNYKARMVYEKWGAVLDDFNKLFVILGKEYQEVFYTCEI